jgi:stage III sporulation protein AH
MVMEREQDRSVRGFVGKIGKRGVVIAVAVVLIGAAVFANWFLFADSKDGFDGYDQGSDVGGSLNTGTDATDATGDDYFATMQVSRKRSRDEALEVLQSVVDNVDADEAVKTQALSDINRLALEMTMESNIETLVMGKGFADCVAVINGDSATVVVKTGEDGLLANQIAQINEIVYEQAEILPVNIKITERK